jgi:hypothetical protein
MVFIERLRSIAKVNRGAKPVWRLRLRQSSCANNYRGAFEFRLRQQIELA